MASRASGVKNVPPDSASAWTPIARCFAVLHQLLRDIRSNLTFGLFGLLCIATTVAAQSTSQAETPASAEPSLGLNQTTALQLSQSVIGNKIDDFTLLDRESRPVRLSQYRGKPLVVSFIYTGCFQVCPLTTRSLQSAIDAGKAVYGTNQFNVISIGFNLPADSPQALKSFARQYKIDNANWDFLSPHEKIVGPLTQQFGFSYVATPAGFDHILQATLLDAEGRVYRQIYGTDLTPESVGEPIRELMNNAPVAQKLQLEDLIDRVRILCTVYDPKTGKYEVKYGLFIEIAGGVTFILAVLWFFMAEWLSQWRRRRRAPAIHDATRI